jgi:disulfide bond formation protein DsbB
VAQVADEEHAEEANEDDYSRSGGLVPLVLAVLVVLVVGFGVFAFLDSSRVEIAAVETTVPGSQDTTAPDGGSGDPAEGGGDAAAGEATYQGTCSACHAPDAGGIDGLGPALANSEFVQSMSSEELVAFIAVGRDAGDPENKTGVGMPPRGGNPTLTDEDLLDVVAWLHTLQ